MSELLDKLGSRGDVLCHLDFETYFDKDFTLRKLTTEHYVRDPRFEVLGVGVKWGARPTVWLEPWDFEAWVRRVDWSRVALNAHHSQFDGFILSHHYGVKPRFWYDTLSMARALHGPVGVALDILSKKYGIGEKSEGLDDAKGKRRADFTQAQWLRFGEYCKNDVELTAKLHERMVPKLPVEELWTIDTTVRMFTEPVFVADAPLLERTLAEERRRKREILLKIAPTYEQALEQLGSSDKFAELLRAQGIDPPLKLNNKGEEIYAFAQTDSGMKALLEDNRDTVRLLAEARLEAKSNIVETRVERMLGCARRGAIPFYLKYCLGGDTRVLTDRGWIPILQVTQVDRVWDGVEWVAHSGVVEQGERDVLQWMGLSATPDHQFLTPSGWVEWQDLTTSENAFQQALTLAAGSPSSIGSSCEPNQGGVWGCNLSSAATADVYPQSTADTSPSACGAGGAAPSVVRSTSRDTESSSQTLESAHEFSHASTASSPAVQTQLVRHSGITVVEGSRSSPIGSGITPSSSSSSKRSSGGTDQSLTWIGSIMPGATSPGISVSSHDQRTAVISEKLTISGQESGPSRQKMQTYDLAFSGPRNRFVVLTDAGPIIVHNCGAHTHRDSGGDKMNPQNFNRGGALRAAILAPQ